MIRPEERDQGAQGLVVAVMAPGGCGWVIEFAGGWFEFEVDLVGFAIEEWALSRPPSPGIWVWEGVTLFWHTCGQEGCDCEPVYDGAWRRPSARELFLISRGISVCNPPASPPLQTLERS